MTYLFLLASIIIGFSVGVMTMHYKVVLPLKRKHTNQLAQATLMSLQALMATLKMSEHSTPKMKKEKDGSVISPYQVGREGS